MDQKKIGQFIAQRRKERDMTQKQLADAIGVSDKTISKWETGNGLPDLTLLNVLCRELEINVNELLSGEKLPPETYSEKAEENIMHLLEENQKTKKSMWIQVLFGVFLLLFGVFFLVASSYGVEGITILLPSFLDLPSLIMLVLFTAAVTLLAGPVGKRGLVSIIRKSLLPVGFTVTLFQVMTVLLNADVLEYGIVNSHLLVICLDIALIPMFYASIGYLIFWVLEERMSRRETTGVHETEAQSQ